MSKNLFEALDQIDSEILNDSAKDRIKQAFNESVKSKVQEEKDVIADTLDEYITASVDNNVKQLQESFDKAVANKTDELLTEAKAKLNQEYADAFKEEYDKLVEALDKHVTYVAKEFINENKIAMQEELKVKKAEAIMESTAKFAETFAIDLTKITDDEVTGEKLDEAISKNLELEKELKELRKEKIVNESTGDLTQIDRDKIKSLVESVDYNTEDELKQKIEVFKSAFTAKTKNVNESRQTSISKKVSWK